MISVRPSFLVEDSYLSPFNVTIPVEIKPFTLEETKRLNLAHKNIFESIQLEQLWSLVNGHPYLLQLLFAYVLDEKKIANSPSFITKCRNDRNGVFSDHLKSLEKRIQLNSEHSLSEAVRAVLKTRCCANTNAVNRLISMGIIRWDREELVMANDIYQTFFSERL